jgi:hypothetical protein
MGHITHNKNANPKCLRGTGTPDLTPIKYTEALPSTQGRDLSDHPLSTWRQCQVLKGGVCQTPPVSTGRQRQVLKEGVWGTVSP